MVGDRMNRQFRSSKVAIGVLSLFAAGCGARTAEFNGHVTYHGKPVFRGSITVVGPDKKVLVAAIDDNGAFTLPNVPVGEVKIGVLCPEAAIDPAGQTESEKKLGGLAKNPETGDIRLKWFRIPDRYGDPESSGLTVEISK